MGDSHKIDARGCLSPRVGVQIGDFGLSEGVQDEKLILNFTPSVSLSSKLFQIRLLLESWNQSKRNCSRPNFIDVNSRGSIRLLRRLIPVSLRIQCDLEHKSS